MKIGLIAGNRRFPILFAQAARQKGYSVVAVAIKGDTSACLKKCVDKIYWLGLGDFSRLFEIFKAEGISKIAMAGQISPHRLFSKEVERDCRLQELLGRIKDKKADTIFGEIARILEGEGLELINSTIFLEDLLPNKGVLTKTDPGASMLEDIDFGLGLARSVAGLDIGQAIAVKTKAVVAVEALEGTDNLIRRAGKISRGGFVLVKVSKPKQDMRFDVPVVGLATVKNLIRAGAGCLAIEAGKTLFIDKEKALMLADKKGLCVAAV